MNIVIIHGQSHKGISYHIGRHIVNQLDTEDHITEFFLPKDLPYFCSGCMQCMHKGETACPHTLSLTPITKAIHEAQILVFTTPVYCFRTTAGMKSLLDHTFTWWLSHTPQEDMYFKQAIIVGVGASVGMKKAIADIKINLRFWGLSNIISLPVRGLSPSWEKMEAKVKDDILKRADKLVEKAKKQRVQVSLKSKLLFLVFRKMQLANWNACPQDKAYWEDKGWLAKKRPWHINHE